MSIFDSCFDSRLRSARESCRAAGSDVSAMVSLLFSVIGGVCFDPLYAGLSLAFPEAGFRRADCFLQRRKRPLFLPCTMVWCR
jgi:hypothetical protein